jgi:hypothetical protein
LAGLRRALGLDGAGKGEAAQSQYADGYGTRHLVSGSPIVEGSKDFSREADFGCDRTSRGVRHDDAS